MAPPKRTPKELLMFALKFLVIESDLPLGLSEFTVDDPYKDLLRAIECYEKLQKLDLTKFYRSSIKRSVSSDACKSVSKNRPSHIKRRKMKSQSPLAELPIDYMAVGVGSSQVPSTSETFKVSVPMLSPTAGNHTSQEAEVEASSAGFKPEDVVKGNYEMISPITSEDSESDDENGECNGSLGLHFVFCKNRIFKEKAVVTKINTDNVSTEVI